MTSNPSLKENIKLHFEKIISEIEDYYDLSLAVVAINLLAKVVESSSCSTVMEFTNELKEATIHMEQCIRDYFKEHPTHVPLSITAMRSGCDLFVESVTRQFLEIRDFNIIKESMTKRGRILARLSETSRKTISKQLKKFVTRDITIFVYGYSRTIIEALKDVSESRTSNSVRFEVIVPQCHPSNLGNKVAKLLREASIPTTVITDASIGYYMKKAEFMLTSAESVVENGGIINTVGTYQAAVLAHLNKKPVYVLAESFRFVRFFPLNQEDTSSMEYVNTNIQNTQNPQDQEIVEPNADFTPPQYITLLLTDLGILTPSGVSDELIKLGTAKAY